MLLFVPLWAENAHFLRSCYVGWGQNGQRRGFMIGVHLGCGGMKPENLQLGNIDCMALKL